MDVILVSLLPNLSKRILSQLHSFLVGSKQQRLFLTFFHTISWWLKKIDVHWKARFYLLYLRGTSTQSPERDQNEVHVFSLGCRPKVAWTAVLQVFFNGDSPDENSLGNLLIKNWFLIFRKYLVLLSMQDLSMKLMDSQLGTPYPERPTS